MSQDDDKSQSSNNDSDDWSDDEEVMIKQESNYEGKGDLDAIEEENRDQILNGDQDFSIIQKLSSGVREKHYYLKMILLKLLREIINLEFQKSNYFQKRLEEYLLQLFTDITIHWVIRVRYFEKGSGAKKVITSEMKDAINKLIGKGGSVSLEQLTEKVNLMGFEVSKESIRKHLISEGFKSLAPVEAYELTNE